MVDRTDTAKSKMSLTDKQYHAHSSAERQTAARNCKQRAKHATFNNTNNRLTDLKKSVIPLMKPKKYLQSESIISVQEQHGHVATREWRQEGVKGSKYRLAGLHG